MTRLEKLGLVFYVDVRRSGRRTYVNLPDTDVKACRMEPGDVLRIELLEIDRASKTRRPPAAEKTEA